MYYVAVNILFRPRHMMGTLEVIVVEASKVKIVLPNVSALKEALQKAKDWSNKVEKVQVKCRKIIVKYCFFVDIKLVLQD